MRHDPSRRVANLLDLAPAAADAAKLLGVQWTAVAAVVDACDHHTTDFRQLAEEWLEEHHVRGRPRLEEAGRARGANRSRDDRAVALTYKTSRPAVLDAWRSVPKDWRVAERAPVLAADSWDVAVGLQLQPDGDERHSLELLVAAVWRADGRRICDRVVGHIMTRAATHPHSRCHP